MQGSHARRQMPNYLLRIWKPFSMEPVKGITPFASLEAAQSAYDAAVKESADTTVQLRERQGHRSDRVIAERKGGAAFSCPKCGTTHHSTEFEDEGEGAEAGRTFRYCSEACKEKH
jgi:predicted RNA-binding Zn-ribbon protein involved in translation (DUF1610 family)